MTKQEKYNLAKWAMNHALENGAQQASVSISNSRSSSVEVREEKIDKLEQAIQSSLSIRLFVDNKYSAHSTNRLKKEELSRFIEEAIAGTATFLKMNSEHCPTRNFITMGEGRI
jgi:PmbA protein